MSTSVNTAIECHSVAVPIDVNSIREPKNNADKMDRKIIALLEVSPQLTQSDIAKQLGMSQSSIAVRLYKLQHSQILVESTGINYAVLGIQMCRADVKASSEDNVLSWARRCPLFINASRGIGENSLSLYFTAEDNDMFHYIVDEHLRKIEGVSEVKFVIIRSWERPYMLQLDLDYANKENPPCGMNPYCPKCPSNPKYNGRIWNHKRLKDLLVK